MEKLCPRCGESLTDDDTCKNCNLTVNLYKKIINISNLLYNEGLELARIHDLTSAIRILNQSIKYNKDHIHARNLLGLIYFEMGETVQALRHWVISKNIESTDNIANEYLERIQDNQSNLDRLNTAIKKYNQSLNYIHQKSEDLAIIQLKKVVSLNPNFIKAYCLLALLYIKSNQEGKAIKYLQKVLAIDHNNYIAKKYLSSMKEEEPEPIVEDSISPIESRNFNPIGMQSSLQQFGLIIVGLILGLAVGIFLITPSRIESRQIEIDRLKDELATTQEDLSSQRNLYQSESEKNAQLEQANLELREQYEHNLELAQELEKIILALQFYEQNNIESSARTLSLVDDTKIQDSEVNEWYENFNRLIAKEAYELGRVYYWRYNNDDYIKAIELFGVSLELENQADFSDDAIYYKGLSYYNMGNNTKALENFQSIIQNYSESNYFNNANWYTTELQ